MTAERMNLKWPLECWQKFPGLVGWTQPILELRGTI